jgi:hypothetical protein
MLQVTFVCCCHDARLSFFQASSGTCRPDISESPELRQKSPLFQFAEVMFASYT